MCFNIKKKKKNKIFVFLTFLFLCIFLYTNFLIFNKNINSNITKVIINNNYKFNYYTIIENFIIDGDTILVDNLPRFVNITNFSGEVTQMGYHLKKYGLRRNCYCYYSGVTLFMENSAGANGHIGHYSEAVSKLFLMKLDKIDRIRIIDRDGPYNDWESKFLMAALNTTNIPPIITGNSKCCFEIGIFPQYIQQWQMSIENGDKIRERVYDFCKINKIKRKIPVLGYLPRFHNRKINNVDKLLQIGNNFNFSIYKNIEKMENFCEQVQIMADIDILFTRHGSHLTNIMFMNPYSVVIEINGNFNWPVFKIMAYYSRINYLEYNDAINENNDDPKNSNVIMDETDFEKYIKFARKIWKNKNYMYKTCMVPSDNWYTFHEINFEKCGLDNN
jgi:hypothetical protein